MQRHFFILGWFYVRGCYCALLDTVVVAIVGRSAARFRCRARCAPVLLFKRAPRTSDEARAGRALDASLRTNIYVAEKIAPISLAMSPEMTFFCAKVRDASLALRLSFWGARTWNHSNVDVVIVDARCFRIAGAEHQLL